MNPSFGEQSGRVTVTEHRASCSAWLSLSGTSLLHQQAQHCDNHTTYSPFIIISFSFLALKGLPLQGPSLSDRWHSTRLVSPSSALSISSPIMGELEKEKRTVTEADREARLLNERKRWRVESRSTYMKLEEFSIRGRLVDRDTTRNAPCRLS